MPNICLDSLMATRAMTKIPEKMTMTTLTIQSVQPWSGLLGVPFPSLIMFGVLYDNKIT